ncbi:hypothetical protein MMC30_004506 [Trapelia coarctata]|nr:hypothetical protein [Trapelia coarctata]
MSDSALSKVSIKPGGGMSLRSKIRAIPVELQDMILTELLLALLQPGKVYAKKLKSGSGAKGPARPELIDLLKGIPSSWLQKAHNIFYGAITWVVPAGGYLPAAKFFLGLPKLDLDRIVLVEVAFRWQDGIDHFRSVENLAWFDLAARAGRGEDLSTEEVASYILFRPVIQPAVVMNWSRKILTVKALRLQHLKLDFSLAKDVRGNFMALDAMAWYTASFSYAQPSHLEVVAPTAEDEKAVLEVIKSRSTNERISEECSLCRNGQH